MINLPHSRTRLCIVAVFAAISLCVASPSHAQDEIFSRETDKTEEKKAVATSAGQKAETETTEPAPASKTNESTAKIEQQSDGWFTISDDASMVEVRLPSKPKYKELSWSPIAGRKQLVNHIYKSLAKNGQMAIDYSWWDMHTAPSTKKELKEALEGAVKGSVVNVFGQLDRMEKVKSGDAEGREFDFQFTMNLPDGKKPLMSGRSRVFIKDSRRYQVTVISYAGKEDDELTKKVFDSLLIK